MTRQILHLIDQYKIGGPGKTILNSARLIDRDCYRIHVATFLPAHMVETELTRRIQEQDIPALYLPDRRGLSIQTLAALNRYIQQQGIDILHCHGYKSEYYAYLLKFFYHHPVIVTTHHGWIANNQNQQIVNRATQLLSVCFDGVIVVAADLLPRLPPAVRRRATTRVIHNGIVLEDYKPAGQREVIRKQYGLTPNDIVLGVIGRLNLEKGCFESLATLDLLRGRYPNVKLLFVGDGPLHDALAEQGRKTGLGDHIRFTGHIHPVQPIYEAIDILVSPSYTEGISNVILEAMALRKPVVATAVGGTPEILADGATGRLVPPRNAQALAQAIAQTIDQPAHTRRRTAGAYETLLQKFEFKKRMRRVEEFYEEVLKNSR